MPTETERIRTKWAQYLADIHAYRSKNYASKHPQRRKPKATSGSDAETNISGLGQQGHTGGPVHKRVARCSTKC